MSSKVYWIARFENGSQLGIMARPRGGEWLKEEITGLARQKVGVLVCLLEASEVTELDLRAEGECCAKMGISFFTASIRDRDVPVSGERMETFIGSLVKEIDSGVNVVIHCRMGIGRSSIIAGAVLLRKGWKTDVIIREISSARGMRVPDTEEQVRWLRTRELVQSDRKQNGR